MRQLILVTFIMFPYSQAWTSENACYEVVTAFENIRSLNVEKKIVSFSVYEQAQSRMDQCVASLYNKCYSKLQEEISWPTLMQIFNQSIQDGTGRMNYPGADCYARAYVLSQRLANAGYASKQLWIQEVPAFVAINLSSAGRLSSFAVKGDGPVWYNDYEGGHAAVSIRARVTDGGVKNVILDPQFFSIPVDETSYFVATTGQTCVDRTSLEKSKRPFWGCSYVKKNSFETLESGAWMNSDRTEINIEKCGWNHAAEYTAEIAASNRRNPPPIPFPSQIDVRRFRNEMILSGYQRKKLAAEKRLSYLKSKNIGLEEQQELATALALFPQVEEQIQRNLIKTP